MSSFYRQSWEKLSEAYQVGSEAATRNDERHGDDYQRDAATKPEGQRLAKDDNAEEHCGDWFQRAQYGGRGGADVLDGLRGA